jgi:hypothetical protein
MTPVTGQTMTPVTGQTMTPVTGQTKTPVTRTDNDTCHWTDNDTCHWTDNDIRISLSLMKGLQNKQKIGGSSSVSAVQNRDRFKSL